MHLHPPRKALVITGTATLLLGIGGAAGAAITASPVSGGVIYGCYATRSIRGSHTLVLQDKGTSCGRGDTAIQWNQEGPAGPAGPAGPPGSTGPSGATGPQGPPGTGATVRPLASGDANCPNGGAAVTDGSGHTADACNGAPGAQGPPGTQGPAGPSTAGPPGLNVITVISSGTASPQPSLTVATCPADHPYLIGGGGSAGAGQIQNGGPIYMSTDAPMYDVLEHSSGPGATTVDVAGSASAGFTPGMTVTFEPGTPDAETDTITSITDTGTPSVNAPPGSVYQWTLATPLVDSHGNDTLVQGPGWEVASNGTSRAWAYCSQ